MKTALGRNWHFGAILLSILVGMAAAVAGAVGGSDFAWEVAGLLLSIAVVLASGFLWQRLRELCAARAPTGADRCRSADERSIADHE